MTMSYAPSAEATTSTTASASPGRDERRAHPRFHLRLAITLQGDNNFYAGMTSDLSEGGVFIATQHILPIGTPVLMQFHLERFATDLTVHGVVCWVRDVEATARHDANFGGGVIGDGDEVKAGMGVRFDGLSATDAQVIRAFMDVRAPEFFD